MRRAIGELKRRGYVKGDQQVAIVQSGRKPIWRSASTHAIQVVEFCHFNRLKLSAVSLALRSPAPSPHNYNQKFVI